MKKTLKKVFASLLALALVLGGINAVPMQAAAAEDEYLMFLAYGGDAAASNDWGYQYYGDGASTNVGEVTATTAMAKVGDTVTIGLTLPTPAVYTWFMAPVIVAPGVTNVDYTIDKVTMDGNDITSTVDLTIGEKAWWYEGTGDYTAEQAIRIKGGYNEWADKFIATSPANFTTIEYTITLNSLTFDPAANAEYEMFLAYGGDAAASNDWGFQYYGDGASTNVGDVVATNAKAKVGDTVTIGLTLPSPAVYTWFMAPVIVAEGVTNLDYTIDKVTMDGNDVTSTVDLTVGDKAFWYEGTGDYTAEQAIRIKGGYNEWADKFIATSPANFTTIEYTITLKAVEVGGAAGGAATLSEESYQAFIAFGGDVAASNDWGFQYYGDGAASNAGDVVAVNGTVKSGETTKLSLEFPSEVFYTWFVAPCVIVEDTSLVDAQTTFDVKVYIDGTEVATDLTAGKPFWAEATADFADTQCLRVGGGYNEWGDKYLATSPAGFKKIEFEITPMIYMGQAAPEEPQPEFDPNGTYHAYFGVQTPSWIFRNSWDDATYGKDSGCFDQMGFIEGSDWLALGGTFTDVEITGNGTYTVAVNGYDFSGTYADAPIMGTEGLFNLLFVSTDLPMNDAVVISNVVLKMDGKEIVKQAEAFLDQDSKEYKKVLLANIWNKEISALPYYAAPTSSIEISFDVSGFANDKPADEAPVDTPVETPESTDTPATTPADDTQTSAPADEGGAPNMVVIIVVVVAVVVVAAVAGVVVAKKKKSN